MINDEQVRAIALFFLFSLMDEKVAIEAAHKTVVHLKASKGRGEFSGSHAELVRHLRKMHDHYRHLLARNRPTQIPDAAWELTDKNRLASWIKFQKDAAEVELIAVVLSKIVGISDEAIADGLNVSLGTARYRIGKGVRALGQVIRHTSIAPTAKREPDA